MLDNGIFAGHVVCPTVEAETATYTEALTLYIFSQTTTTVPALVRSALSACNFYRHVLNC